MNAHCKTHGIEHMITVAHNPSGQGIVERANSELQRHIRALTTALQAVQPDEWPNRLHLATGIMNHTNCSSIGASPACLAFGSEVYDTHQAIAGLLPVEFDSTHEHVTALADHNNLLTLERLHRVPR